MSCFVSALLSVSMFNSQDKDNVAWRDERTGSELLTSVFFFISDIIVIVGGINTACIMELRH